jgi:hypothetical protein
LNIANSNQEKLQQKEANRDSPPSQIGLHNTIQPQRNCTPLDEKTDDTVVSPLLGNGSLPVENCIMNGCDDDNNLLLPPAKTTKGSEIDDDGFKQYLQAQQKKES